MKYSILFLVGALCLAGCSQNNEDEKAARALMAQAEANINDNRPERAIELLDSLDHAYPAETAVRREAMSLRPKAMEQITIAQIAATDSILLAAQAEIERLSPEFKHIPGNGLEGYYVYAKAYNPNFVNAAQAVEPRVNDANFMFYIAAQNRGKATGLNAIAITDRSGATCRSEAIPASSARLVNIEGAEMASFLPEEVDSLGRWCAERPESLASVSLTGPKGSVNIKLNAAQAEAYAAAYRFAAAHQRRASGAVVREKLDRQLQLTREQQARVMTNEE